MGKEYHYCGTAAGENCATCSFDCKCDAGYVCDPTSANANYMGCVRVEEKKEENAMVCGGKVCKMFCLKDYRYDIKTGQWVPADYSMIPVRCSEGVQCTYAPAMYCKTGCNSNTGKCLPDDASADGCIEDGEYIIQSASGKLPVKRAINKDGSSEITILQLVSHAKHCVGDYISTDAETKVWIKHKNGMISYIGPGSQYVDGSRGKNVVEAKGKIQIKNPGAPTEEEKGIVTVVPLQIAAEIQEGADYGTVSHIHHDLRDFYIKNTLKGGPIDIWVYNQHSNVIYDIYDDHEIVTVLEGEVVVTDSKTKQQFSLTAGKQLTHELGQEIQPNMQQNIEDVDLSRMEDNSTPPEGSVSANGGVCTIGLFMILLLISLYIIKGRVD
ncbi:MAG: hypothetical protein QXF35_02580 [Candidatus Bilamarchaeaceae archaeon]